MAETVTNVSAASPAKGGAVYRAPLGTTLPTTASETLSGYVGLGFCSDDGVTNTNSPESETIKAFGGQPVLSKQTGKEDTYKFKLIEVLNDNVLKAVYGDDNVTGSLSTGLTVKANNDEAQEAVWIIDLAMRDGAAKRIVLPDAKVSEIGDIVYKDNEAVGYELTLTAMPDTDGQTHYEYIVKAPSGATGATGTTGA